MWLEPKLIGEDEGGRLGIMPGWWALASDGTPVSGPYPTEEAAIVSIGKRDFSQPTGRPGDAGPPPEE